MPAIDSVAVKPADPLEQLTEYRLEHTDFEVRLKLDVNEGPAVPIDSELLNLQNLNRYPDRKNVEQQIADRFGVDADQVIVTAGGDEAIDRICRSYLGPGRNLIFPTPSFAMIAKYGILSGGEVRNVDWVDDFPVDAILASSDESTSIVSVVSPNNPTGKTVDFEQLKRLSDALPQAVILVDQAYAEFEDFDGSQSMSSYALEDIPNAIVVRTFSKAWCLAGLRVGYAIGAVDLITNLRKAGGPFPVSSVSLAVVESLLSNQPEGNSNYIAAAKRQRRLLEDQLTKHGCSVTKSSGNFVYASFENARIDSATAFRALRGQGILVRQFPNENALRIACPGDGADFDYLTLTLEKIFTPQAVLFDMDGVLVDESPSYREAIRLTCDSFGCQVSMEEITAKKLCGDANNDWVFTHRLLAEHGFEMDYEAVKSRFEAIYQGDDQNAGLWDREKPLVDSTWLKSLAKRFPLAIVTGRPRSDASRFLENAGIQDCFQAIVCMEDGPAKPDPANVRTALNQLNVELAWMIGDTPDDINAARAAGVIPFGIVAPNDDLQNTTKKLINDGAAKVVEKLGQFGDLLP